MYQFDPGALLGRSYPLADGSRVSLRVARSSDSTPILSLAERQTTADGTAGGGVAALEVARLVSFDPRRQCVICATSLIEGGERLVGVGAVQLDGDATGRPETVIVDPDAPEGLRELLTGALVGRARALVRDRAA